jgi:hypothetical protein
MSDAAHAADAAPAVLTTAPDEARAAILVAALNAHGLEARAVGGLTSGFRAEVPGGVRVLVHQGDLAAAREVLAALESETSRPDVPEDD